jgi:hypothetical protein
MKKTEYNATSPARQDGETMEQYRRRRKLLNLYTKIYKTYGSEGMKEIEEFLQATGSEQNNNGRIEKLKLSTGPSTDDAGEQSETDNGRTDTGEPLIGDG